jgi:hypothetical protein
VALLEFEIAREVGELTVELLGTASGPALAELEEASKEPPPPVFAAVAPESPAAPTTLTTRLAQARLLGGEAA